MIASAPVGSPLTEIRLYGALGALFGRSHWLAVRSVREACQALAAVVPGFERFMVEHSRPGFHVFLGRVGQASQGAADIDNPVSAAEPICIVPVVAGAKRQGTWQVIVGVILVVVAAFATSGASLTVSGGIWGAVSAFGVSMAIGGVVQLLSPQSKQNAAAAEAGSRSFAEAAATSPQGLPVPLTFGRCFVRGVVVSAGLSTDLIAAEPTSAPANPLLPDGLPRYPGEPGEFSGPSADADGPAPGSDSDGGAGNGTSGGYGEPGDSDGNDSSVSDGNSDSDGGYGGGDGGTGPGDGGGEGE